MTFALPVWLTVQEELLESDDEDDGARSCFDEFEDEALEETFHLSRPCLDFIRDAVLVRMQTCTLRKVAPSVDVMLQVALNYYAHGHISLGVLQRGMRFQADCPAIVSAASGVIAGMSDQFISFPLLQGARASVASKTERVCGIPNVLGVLAPAHFEVQACPKENDAFTSSVGASGSASVVSQVICDLDGNVLSVEKCCVGSTPEQEMWESSFKGREVEKELHGPYWFIGGNGYHLSKHVLTPVRDPSNNKDIRYNEAHAKLYSVMQATLSHMKRRFRCLTDLGFAQKGSLDKKSNIIKACCVLHNIAKKFSVPLPPSTEKTEHVHPDMDDSVPTKINPEAVKARQELINRQFSVGFGTKHPQRRDVPVSSMDNLESKDVPVSSMDNLESKDVPVSSMDNLESKDVPVSSMDNLESKDVPVSSMDNPQSKDVPVSSMDNLESKDVPVSSMDNPQSKDVPVSSMDNPQSKDVPVSSMKDPQSKDVPVSSIKDPQSKDVPVPSIKDPQSKDVPVPSVKDPKTKDVPVSSMKDPQSKDVPVSSIKDPQSKDVPVPSVKDPKTKDVPVPSVKDPKTKDVPVPSVKDPQTKDIPVPSVEDPQTKDVPVPSVEDPQTKDIPVPSVEDPQTKDIPVPSVEDPQTKDIPVPRHAKRFVTHSQILGLN